MFLEKISDFFNDFCESEKHRLLNFIPVGIGTGIFLYFFLPTEPNFFINISVLVFALLLTVFTRSFRWLSYIFLTISLGFFFSQLRTNLVDTYMLTASMRGLDNPISFIATVKSCEKTENGLKFLVENVECKNHPKICKLSLTWRGKRAMEWVEDGKRSMTAGSRSGYHGRDFSQKRGEGFVENRSVLDVHEDLRQNFDEVNEGKISMGAGSKDYLPGSKVKFCAILSPVSPQSFPGAYDFRKQLYFKGISARGFIIKSPKILGKVENTSFDMVIEQLRHRINKKIETRLMKETASVAEALTTGNQSGISKKIRSYFVNSGTAHILAIAGLQIGIVGFFVFWLFRVFLCCFLRIAMFYDIKKIATIISWVAVLFYVCISGKSVPSIRAFIMHTLVTTAILLNRTPLTMRSVAIAATLIMICTPEVIFSPGFQMSFGAVIAIVAFFENRIYLKGFFNALLSMVSTTVVASIPTALFSVNTFNQLTLNSVLANIMAVPILSFFVMPLAVISLFLMIFDFANPALFLMELGVCLLIRVAEVTSKLPGSFFVMHTPSVAVMIILVFSGLWLTLIHHKICRLGIVGIFIGLVCYFFQPIPDIFISPYGRVIGIKTDDAVCFNHLGYFRSMTSDWTKSVGFEKREKFNTKACRKYITKINKNSYIANIKNKKILISDVDGFKKDGDIFLKLGINQEPNQFAELIYYPSMKRVSTDNIQRPWS